MSNSKELTVIGFDEVTRRTKLSGKEVFSRVFAGLFPAPIFYGEVHLYWSLGEINEFNKAQARGELNMLAFVAKLHKARNAKEVQIDVHAVRKSPAGALVVTQ